MPETPDRLTPAAQGALLEVHGLWVAYGKHVALDGASMHVGEREIVVVLGSNGAGKSTLLKAVAGLVPVRSGSVRFVNAAITHAAAHRVVEEGIALVPEGRGVFGELTVRENLLLGAHPQRARARERAHLAFVLELFPRLQERLRQAVRTMSGGEQQMVAIGRALMSAPRLLLLDEPSLGLSPLLSREVFRVLTRVRDVGVSVLLVEQNAKQSLAIADRGYLIETGRMVGQGSAEQLRSDPAVQRAYLGGANWAQSRPRTPGNRDVRLLHPTFRGV
ncbi:MAG: ABC transporter ATP-binding protein [Trueperaceae bacterium]